MAEIGAYTIARWITDDTQSPSYTSLRSVIEATLKLHTSFSEEQVFETSEKLEEKIYFELEKISELLIYDGVEPSFFLDGIPQTAYVKAGDLTTIPILEKMRKITPTEFEQVCADLLTELGGITRTIGKTGDGGVDFIATGIPITGFDLPALKVCSAIVIGQAKRYSDNHFVTVNEVRDFVGGALILQDEVKRENERYGLFTPVLLAFWTTSDFSKPAYDYCRKCGLWNLTGLSLAQLAIRLKVEIKS